MDTGYNLLGANAAEYRRPMEDGLEQREFDWAGVKRRQIAGLLQSIGPIAVAADIGCRGGKEAAFYRDEAAIGHMHGFEIAKEALVVAKQRGLTTHVWISGSDPCPVANGTFNAVTALDVIEHLFDTDIFLSEIHRILAPGGHFVVATPNLAWWWSRLRLMTGLSPAGIGGASPSRSFDRSIDLKHLRLSVSSEWRNLFVSHGFTCIRIVGYNFPGLLRLPFDTLDNALIRFPTVAHSVAFLLRKV